MTMNATHKKTACGFLLSMVAWLSAQPATAAGFYIPEVGSPASLGTGGVANPTNTFGADAAWTNPAGMTGLKRDQIFSGVQAVIPRVEFDSSTATAGGSDGGNAGNTAFIPSFFYVNKLNDRTRLGISLVAPMGGGVNYGAVIDWIIPSVPHSIWLVMQRLT
jgi:long-chain fatty acid transport protein